MRQHPAGEEECCWIDGWDPLDPAALSVIRPTSRFAWTPGLESTLSIDEWVPSERPAIML